jgi:hypothetical protein
MDTDPSTGDTHAYGKNVRMDSIKVLEELCPSGIPKDCLDALGETLPDVAAILGTYSSAIAEDSDLLNQLGLMLTSVVHGQDMRATYGITTDNQWKSAHRVRLKKVMSEKKGSSRCLLPMTSWSQMRSRLSKYPKFGPKVP